MYFFCMCGHSSICSVNLGSVNCCTEISLNALDQQISQSLLRTFVHILRHIFNCLVVYNSALVFTSCLHRTSPSLNGESWGLSHACHSPGHASSPMKVPGLLDFQEYFRAFKSLLWTSHSPSFLLSFFLSSFCLPQVLSSLMQF